mmetsp:Transcript_748/g.1582  ORF Transcript_748/g.1582 Transcript_748/m.1582 type:complete len:218 (-) Transcript_748:85-738(-)
MALLLWEQRRATRDAAHVQLHHARRGGDGERQDHATLVVMTERHGHILDALVVLLCTARCQHGPLVEHRLQRDEEGLWVGRQQLLVECISVAAAHLDQDKLCRGWHGNGSTGVQKGHLHVGHQRPCSRGSGLALPMVLMRCCGGQLRKFAAPSGAACAQHPALFLKLTVKAAILLHEPSDNQHGDEQPDAQAEQVRRNLHCAWREVVAASVGHRKSC